MLFVPRKFKFKKQRKGKNFNQIKGSSTSVYQLNSGIVGLKAISASRVNSKQLDTIRQSISKVVKKTGKVIINVFPSIPVTKKPIEIRMGKGKGNVDHWVTKIKPGLIVCEVVTDQLDIALKALKNVQKKINIRTKIVIN